MCDLTIPDLSLLNPVTNCKVSLPSLPGTASTLVWASLDPVQAEDYAVCLLGYVWTPAPRTFSAFLQPGEVKWTIINQGSYQSCYYKGMYIHANNISNSLEIYDVATQTLREGPVFPTLGLSYLVVSAGQVIGVLKYDNTRVPVHRCQFEIYRLEIGTDEKRPSSAKISNIGDQILFLNSVNGFSISAYCFEGLRGNFIYFMKLTRNGFDDGICYVLARYDIEAGTAEVLPFPPVTQHGMWFLPSLRYA
ncbi:F-box domain-containing protein [Rhynchospora pubera]|uniref:F-box domain-containing protein n=1 Tax=Rhynchospora pubera TaxID=906938 RepID=A0AAV8G1A2_9POAL|nr:F-box domain-containing protein [Rhynchospora pubera]